MPNSSTIVVDANLAILHVIGGAQAERVDQLWISWVKQGKSICAPQLWLNEVTSVMHKSYKLGLLDEKKALSAMEAVLELGVEIHSQDIALCRQAFQWASRLNQVKAYDAFYIALAQRLKAECWTADERLANRCQQIGASWVKWAGNLLETS